MLVDIYQSVTNSSKFVFVPAGTDFKDGFILDTQDQDYAKVRLFKSNKELRPQLKRIGLTENENLRIIADLLSKEHSVV